MRKWLMTMSMTAAAACGGPLGTAQASDAETPVQRSFALSGFEDISVVGPHTVTVVVGPAFSVRAEGPAKTFERTEVVVEHGTLKIQPAKDERWNDEWKDYRAARFTVTLPRLAAASMVGSGEMNVDRVEGESFAASVAGSGKLDIAALSVDRANLSIAGSGDLLAHGRARRSEVSVAGSGNLKARDLASYDAAVSIAGSGDAELTVNGEAHVSIVGSGDVDIAGPARCTVSRLGSGEVNCADVRRETEISFR